MNLFKVILINFIFTTFPLIIYLFYIAYNQNIGKKENNLIFDMALLTSVYLIITFSSVSFSLMIINVPLLMAYHKKDKLSIFLMSMFIIVYYFYFYKFNLIFLIIEYVIYYIVYEFLTKKKKETFVLANVFVIIKAFFMTFFMWQIDYYNDNSIFQVLFEVFILSIVLFLIAQFVLILLEKGEEILKYHMSIKDLEKEKQIQTSLFKITHEIKNPMAVCKGYLDMLDINNRDQVKKYIPIVKEEIERTLIILQDFLSITKTKIEKDLMDVNMLVEDVVNSFSPIMKQNNINSNINLLDEEIYINGDYNRLTQVLINIIKNSIEAIDKETGKIDVTTKKIDNIFEIVIKDNGIGMNQETLSRISEPFFTTKKSGTGLGVSFSKEILRAHGADIKYNSIQENGTTVRITIPIENT